MLDNVSVTVAKLMLSFVWAVGLTREHADTARKAELPREGVFSEKGRTECCVRVGRRAKVGHVR